MPLPTSLATPLSSPKQSISVVLIVSWKSLTVTLTTSVWVQPKVSVRLRVIGKFPAELGVKSGEEPIETKFVSGVHT